MANAFSIPANIDTAMTAATAHPNVTGVAGQGTHVNLNKVVVDGADGSTALTIVDRNSNVIYSSIPGAGDSVVDLDVGRVNGFACTAVAGGVIRVFWS